MPNISDVYGSQWLKGEDLKGQSVVVEIFDVKPVELTRDGKTEHKLEVQLKGSDKALLLNKTNARALADMHGEDYTRWAGLSFEMFSMPVQGPNGPTTGIRVKAPAGASQPTPNESQPAGDLPF